MHMFNTFKDTYGFCVCDGKAWRMSHQKRPDSTVLAQPRETGRT